MKILITGGGGFIGSAVVRTALAQGHEVVNLDGMTYAANPLTLAAFEGRPGYQFIKADIRDAEAMDRIIMDAAPDKIMHLAAESHVDRSIDGPRIFVETNVIGTLNLLQSSRKYYDTLEDDRKAGFRFHHISTDEVYGDLSADDPAFTETTSYSPSSPYSASKASSDHFVRAWQRTFGLPTLITNCSNNYGPYQFPEKLIPVIIMKAQAGEPLPVYGDGSNIRDWLHVDDHADALLTVLEKGAVGRTYNIGGNEEHKNLDLVHMICDRLDALYEDKDRRSLVTFVTDRPGHDRRYAINGTRIRDELNWEPARNLKDGLDETIQWYMNNRDWWEPLLKAT